MSDWQGRERRHGERGSQKVQCEHELKKPGSASEEQLPEVRGAREGARPLASFLCREQRNHSLLYYGDGAYGGDTVDIFPAHSPRNWPRRKYELLGVVGCLEVKRPDKSGYTSAERRSVRRLVCEYVHTPSLDPVDACDDVLWYYLIFKPLGPTGLRIMGSQEWRVG